MKHKRTFITLVLALALFGCMPVMAAASATYPYDTKCNVYGYVDLLEGPLTFEDRLYYTAQVTGTVPQSCEVGYSVRVGIDPIASGKLTASRKKVSESERKVGYGNNAATLTLVFEGRTEVLSCPAH